VLYFFLARGGNDAQKQTEYFATPRTVIFGVCLKITGRFWFCDNYQESVSEKESAALLFPNCFVAELLPPKDGRNATAEKEI